ncbi:hypothetical protein PV327_005029 [Microctonus hyperodae]|uniref:peptide chain release factor N(5)-glutamine methyltransferase n=1 Tax=Microctonus hyperodae TaxID=165561 RepID=A0AA39FDS6_MICHY|nr:hypothetical protein PV327_005029 [Microctonus hyperodae]
MAHLTTCQRKIFIGNRQSIYSLCASATNVRDTIEYWCRRFKNEGVPEPVESIQHILSHVIGIDKYLELSNLQDKIISEEQTKKLNTLCLKRLSRMPVQYIIGEWAFRDIVIKLVPPIFIPRSETELLVDFVVKQILFENHAHNLPTNILEIGCGSGAISLAILYSCRNKASVECVAIDSNDHACKLTKDNANKLEISDNHITIVNASIEENGNIVMASGKSKIDFFSKQFDIIVSNPPYIPTTMFNKLPSEIKIFEDIKALDGGTDGLKIIKSIIKYASTNLKPSGHLFLEVDSSHPKSIEFFILKSKDMKLQYKHTYKDYYNNDRFVEICKINKDS